jgi:hypothetical protein
MPIVDFKNPRLDFDNLFQYLTSICNLEGVQLIERPLMNKLQDCGSGREQKKLTNLMFQSSQASLLSFQISLQFHRLVLCLRDFSFKNAYHSSTTSYFSFHALEGDCIVAIVERDNWKSWTLNKDQVIRHPMVGWALQRTADVKRQWRSYI